MLDTASLPKFGELLAQWNALPSIGTEDVIAAILPLMEQVQQVHAEGKVAPLSGTNSIFSEGAHLFFHSVDALSPRTNRSVTQRRQAAAKSVRIVDEVAVVSGDDEGVTVTDKSVSEETDAKPRYLTGYRLWEIEAGHHDPLTDIFGLGLLMASLATGLDFSDRTQLETFVRSRSDLQRLNRRLHPVLCRAIERMTALERFERAQDLNVLCEALENYRRIGSDFREALDASAPAADRRETVLLKRLRARLYDTSRRNRMIYHRPVAGELNLTETSVPLVIHVEAIREGALFTAGSDAMRKLLAGQEIVLGDYLRFEEMLFAPSVLDRLRTEATRYSREFGGSPLRLIPVMLHWYDLKNAPNEPITSPLLLLRANLKKRKGVRDVYTLGLESLVAEVNPALAYVLEQLYGFKLPSTIDMADSGALLAFFQSLRNQIQTTEPGIVLSYSDRPKMRLLHRKARRRLDIFHRRTNLAGKLSGKGADLPYSYKAKSLDPLGVKLFRTHVALAEAPLRSLTGRPLPRLFNPVNMLAESALVETEKEAHFLQHVEETTGRFDWSFNLCAVTLANFNYRKMSLVRDFDALVDEPARLGDTFGLMFGDEPRRATDARPDVTEAEKFVVVASDPTQEAAVLAARGGQSYVIQGPPGTGKSQTITNLIADFVGRGKRVLFVCEKRAALDVVHNRLRGAGLGSATALFHDSQSDRSDFIRELSSIYSGWIDAQPAISEKELQARRSAELARIGEARDDIAQLVSTMAMPAHGADVAVHELLTETLASGRSPAASDEQTLRLLPSFKQWADHREQVARAMAGIRRSTGQSTLTGQAGSLIAQQLWSADDIAARIEAACAVARPLLERLRTAQSHLVSDGAPSLAHAVAQVRLAARLSPTARAGKLDVFSSDSPANARLRKAADGFEKLRRKAQRAAEKAANWTDPLSLEEASRALAVAEAKEGSFFSIFSGEWRRTKATVLSRVSLPGTAKPSITVLLRDLVAALKAAAEFDDDALKFEETYGYSEPAELVSLIDELTGGSGVETPGAQHLYEHVVTSPASTTAAVTSLAPLLPFADRLLGATDGVFDGLDKVELEALPVILEQLGQQVAAIRSLQPVLAPLANAPTPVWNTLTRLKLDPETIGHAVVDIALRRSFDAAPQLDALNAEALEHARNRIDAARKSLGGLNARLLETRMVNRFRDHVILTNSPDRDVPKDRRELKSLLGKGRRILENEFSKTRAHKSPRELLAAEAGPLLMEIKPVWLMSPLSVADVLPLDRTIFDVVIFDEASQIPVEDALPTLVRAPQVIVVGDDKQLPPTDFFGTSKSEEDFDDEGDFDFELGQDSLLRLSAAKMPGAMLGWHYRSRSEELIGFSNSAFYEDRLLTVPSVRKVRALPAISIPDAELAEPDMPDLLRRAVSFHSIENGLYSERRNQNEATYIARVLRALLAARTGKTIGIVAFSEAQQGEIETAIDQLASADSAFAELLATERERENDGEFIGLLVKNLENIQGDERDVIILSICYGQDAGGRMLMNFGPINKAGGEKRLNVIFSRARENMMVVSSIRPEQITNDYNIGANTLKCFLSYAEAMSRGNEVVARLALSKVSFAGGARLSGAEDAAVDAFSNRLAGELGVEVRTALGLSSFRIDIALHGAGDDAYGLAILLDRSSGYAAGVVGETLTSRAKLLESFGWQVVTVPLKDLWLRPDDVIDFVRDRLAGRQ